MLGKKHSSMTHGYSTKVGKDGLIVAKPRRRRVRGVSAVRLLLLVAVGFFGFKAFTLAAVGPITYNERVAKLESGTIIEKVGAKALKIDPVTEAVVGSISPVVR
ncbi:hypothetical protein [Sulfitobacter noctilucicola]|nr:hypothetical protein [Sulfitobacter noctilucicola]